MKRTFFTLSIAILCLFAKAQVGVYHRLGATSIQSPKSALLGYEVGLFAETKISNMSGLQFSAGTSRRGSKERVILPWRQDATVYGRITHKIQYVDFSAMYRIKPRDWMAIYGGLYASLNLSTDKRTEWWMDRYAIDYMEGRMDENVNHMFRGDLGAQAFFSLGSGNLWFDFGIRHGLSDILKPMFQTNEPMVTKSLVAGFRVAINPKG